MGIVEQYMRKNVRPGQSVDVTLVGGRELRGQLVSFAQDGFLLLEDGCVRPVAFLGVATFLATKYVQKEIEEPAAPAAPAEQPVPAAEEPVQTPAEQPAEAEAKPVDEKPVEEEKEEIPKPVEVVLAGVDGWVERFDVTAGVGSVAAGGKRAVFALDQVVDEQLAEQLRSWYGKPVAVSCTLSEKGAMCTASAMVSRRTQERYDKKEEGKAQPAQAGERQGFGEIIHFDKREGFGKGKEGDVKFLIRRGDIVSHALWKEIVRADNTCGIKITFTVVTDENGRSIYKNVREIAAMRVPETVKKPDNLPPVPKDAEKDVNPVARTTFTDGSVLEDEIRSGYVLFYNSDKLFGRVQEDKGERYYFRVSDVMRKSLLEQLKYNTATGTRVSFSRKTLPTGKIAAGRVTWEIPGAAQEKPEAQEEKPETQAEATAAQEENAENQPAAEEAEVCIVDGGEQEAAARKEAAEHPSFGAKEAVELLEQQGVLAVLGGGEKELNEMLAVLSEQENCIPVYLDGGSNSIELVSSASKAVKAAVTERSSAEVAGILNFPAEEQMQGLSSEERQALLLESVRSFGDMRLLHDELKEKHVALLIKVEEIAAHTADFAKKMLENGVFTCVTAPVGTEMPCAAMEVRAEAENEGEKQNEIG